MKFNLFPYVVAISALSVSASAAFYSIYGLSNLFAGASTAVIIMASSLEMAKLVTASALYQYWDRVNLFLKVYLSIAIFILIGITSAGIYGFLSGAYQETSVKEAMVASEISILESKQNRFIRDTEFLNNNIQDWSKALANPTTIQYVDRETGQLVTTTSSRQRKVLEAQLEESRIAYIEASDSISSIDIQILALQAGNETTRELGPLKYVSTLIHKPMDSIINWFMLLIIFVFDPLAIALVIVANIAFGKIINPQPPKILEVPKVVEVPSISKVDARQDKVIELILELISANANISPTIIDEKIKEIKKNLYGEKEIK
tara:strand:- start:499 stop:1455 length:957 start_codon:yes stop_codon:yes gene_type:complete